MVAIAGSIETIGDISPKSWLFLALSGLATGGSWLCYYYAIQMGQISVVVQVDKLSLLVPIAFARRRNPPKRPPSARRTTLSDQCAAAFRRATSRC